MTYLRYFLTFKSKIKVTYSFFYCRKDISIRKSVERVLNIWRKRKIYDSEFIDQLLATLLSNRTPDKLKTKILAEYKVY